MIVGIGGRQARRQRGRAPAVEIGERAGYSRNIVRARYG